MPKPYKVLFTLNQEVTISAMFESKAHFEKIYTPRLRDKLKVRGRGNISLEKRTKILENSYLSWNANKVIQSEGELLKIIEDLKTLI